MSVPGFALLATPFAFGLVRFVTTGSDWRYLAVAVGSTLGAGIVNYVRGTTMQFIAGMVSSVALAALASWLTGARNVLSMGIVAASFAFCSVVGAILVLRSRKNLPTR